MRISLLLLFLHAYASAEDDDDEKDYKKLRKKILDKSQKIPLEPLEGYEVLSRRVTLNLFRFTSYQSVTVLHYAIPEDVTEARIMFQAEEVQMNVIGRCSPEEIVVNLKRGTYPAVNADMIPFPKKYIRPETREEKIHSIEFESDGVNKSVYIQNPRPGHWFGVAYIKWEDPEKAALTQEGLVALCYTVLYTDLQVKKADPVIGQIDCYTGLALNTSDVSDAPKYFKCMATGDPAPIKLAITVPNTTVSNESLLVSLKPLSLPTDMDNIVSCRLDPTVNTVQIIEFVPDPNSWHYIRISKVVNNAPSYADCESFTTRPEFDDVENHTIVKLVRNHKGRFFRYEYGLVTSDFEDATSLIDLSSGAVKSFVFEVNEFLDIGGSLKIHISLLMDAKYYMGYRRPVKKGGLQAFSANDSFCKVVVCAGLGHSSLPLPSGLCRYNDKTKPALFVLNTTDSESISDTLTVPYPESGTWYLSMRLFCDGSVCPCNTSIDGTKYYVRSHAAGEEEDLSGEMSGVTRAGETKCNMTVVLALTSNSCSDSQCENGGSCSIAGSSGHLLSYCSCMRGYGGWDCSDDSRAEPFAAKLAGTLLLTLSNVFFMLSIYVAIIRRYYPEAVMFTFTMLASLFYHACDVDAEVRFCITRLNTLQFIDFYCGNMAFWVTLIAMSILSESIRSSLQLSGALGISILLKWNRLSVISFLIPVVVASIIMFSSWAWDYRKTRKLKYSRTYYKFHMPIGLVVVGLGLICFAFLQTSKNYRYVHSLWHILIAVSVAFLLPDWKRDQPVNPFMPK